LVFRSPRHAPSSSYAVRCDDDEHDDAAAAGVFGVLFNATRDNVKTSR
jgi:hypothetical protein